MGKLAKELFFGWHANKTPLPQTLVSLSLYPRLEKFPLWVFLAAKPPASHADFLPKNTQPLTPWGRKMQHCHFQHAPQRLMTAREQFIIIRALEVLAFPSCKNIFSLKPSSYFQLLVYPLIWCSDVSFVSRSPWIVIWQCFPHYHLCCRVWRYLLIWIEKGKYV